jgi:hypothetical protein
MPDLSALKALQARIRQATGPDRELDGRIGFAFGLGHSKNYHECCESHVAGRDGSKLTYSSLAYWQTFPQWTGSLDACVALMMEVLPGCEWGRDFRDFAIYEVPHPDGAWHEIGCSEKLLANDCLTFTDAILSAVIAREEDKAEKEDV